MKIFRDNIKKQYGTPMVLAVTVFALLIRFLCRDYESGDFTGCLKPWVIAFRENGGWRALKCDIGNYNVVYQYILIMISYMEKTDCLYLIKAVSVIFDFVLAAGCAACVGACGGSKEKRRICFSVVLLLPTVWLNSAYWAQCDSIYVAFAVWSIYFLLKKNNKASMAFLAVAFAFKLQTVFIMPVYFVVFMKKEIKLRELLIFLITFFITYVPALVFGKPITEIIGIYLNQTKEYAGLSMNAPSALQLFYAIDSNDLISKVSVAVAGIFTVVIVILGVKREYGKQMILEFALIFGVGIPFLLPHMHDRYFYFADVFAIICLSVYSKKYIPILMLTQFASLICYVQYFDYVNRYFPKISVPIFSNESAALLMCVALILILVIVFSKSRTGKKMFISAALCASCCLMVLKIFSVNALGATIDGKKVSFISMRPVTDGDVVWFPLKNLSVVCGAEVTYDAQSKEIGIKSGERVISMAPGAETAYMNGKAVHINPIRIIDEFSYISYDDFARLFELDYTREHRVIHYKKKID